MSATAHLSMVEDGCYRRLLDAYYTREAPLPADIGACCRLVRAASKDERKAVETVLREFFQLEADGWRHRRCDAEIAKANSKRTKASESANKRWQSERNANAYANELPTQCEGNAPNPNPNPKERVAREPRAPRSAAKVPLPDGFEVSDAVRKWAEGQGYREGADAHLEAFRLKATANAYRYADWDRAFMEAIRADWARLREPKRANGIVVAHPASTTVDQAVMRRISEANGGLAVERLSDGRMRCGPHYYRPDGRQEVAI